MIERDCNACNDIQSLLPNIEDEGITETTYNSIKANTGLNPSKVPQHTNEEDMTKLIECIIHNMQTNVISAESCEWKKVLYGILTNLSEVLKLMVASESGLWERDTTLETIEEE